MILAGPGVPKGETRNGLAYLHGLYPTLASFAGIKAPEYTEPFEFASVIRGNSQGLDRVFGAYMPNVKVPKGVRAVREGQWKLLYYTHSGRKQLFNLEKDPWETNDLIGDPDYADRIDQMFGSLKEWMAKSGDPLGK